MSVTESIGNYASMAADGLYDLGTWAAEGLSDLGNWAYEGLSSLMSTVSEVATPIFNDSVEWACENQDTIVWTAGVGTAAIALAYVAEKYVFHTR